MNQTQLDQQDQLEELQRLLGRVAQMEGLVDRVQAYFDEHHHLWSAGLSSYFMDFLERKREQVEYEWHRIHQLGRSYASAELGGSIDDLFT